jgi:endonuclease YncB( thermonuclease family)
MITRCWPGLLLGFNILHAEASLAACDFDLQGEGHVSSVVDGRTVKLADGREIVLSGLEIPQPSDLAVDLLKKIALSQDVTLHGTVDTPDRYGRQPAFVVVYGSETFLQHALLINGGAVLSGETIERTCLDELAGAEIVARTAKRGIWANRGFVRDATQPHEILNDIGRFIVAEGKVVSARQSGSTLYLNFGRQWIQGFAVTISRRMMDTFTAAGVTAAAVENKWIRVRGWVERRGGPRIEALSPGQIEFVAK